MKGMITGTRKKDLYLPKIESKKRLKKVVISGVSRMLDPSIFFFDLTNMLVEHYHEYKKTLFVEFYFDYINSGSAKWIYLLIQHIESLAKEGGYIEITWKYDQDDESIELFGEVLKSKTKLPFNLFPVKD